MDSGCSQCICDVTCCDRWRRWHVAVETIDGQRMRCLGTGTVQLRVQDVGEVSVDVVVDRSPLGFKFILGMNGITALGGVRN